MSYRGEQMTSLHKSPGLPSRLFFDSSNDAMFVIPISEDGQPQRFHDVNARACQLLGYSRKEILALSPVEIGDNFSLERWRSTSEALRLHGETRFEASFRSRVGRTLWVEVSVRQVELDGRALAMAIARDMSHQVAVEAALRETERDLNALINAHPETVILTTEDSTIVHCNRVGAERLDDSPANLIGQRIIDLSPPEIRAQRLAIMERIKRDRNTACFQDFRNGMHLDHTVAPVTEASGTMRLAVFSRDVTAQFVRHGIENLLGDIDRCILNGGDIDSAVVLVCEQLMTIFYSPWVCIDTLSGQCLARQSHYRGELGAVMERLSDARSGPLAGVSHGAGVSFVPTGELPAHLAFELEAVDCHMVALVPITFNIDACTGGRIDDRTDDSILILIAVRNGPGFRDNDILLLLDHVASRLRVAWGLAREFQQLNLLRQALESAKTAVLLQTVSGLIVWCNRALSDAIGLPEIRILGRQSRDFLVETDTSSLKTMDRTVKAGRVWTGETDIRRDDGSVFTALQSVSPVFERDGTLSHYIVIQEDITSRKKNQERIRHLAEHDSLTGLYNRMSLMRTLETWLADGRRSSNELSLLYLDIDYFKAINDEYGHHVGDQLLVEFAGRIRAVVRHEDLVCRLGGDEFVVVLKHLKDPGATAQVVQNLLAHINEPIHCGGMIFSIGTSIGISTAAGGDVDSAGLGLRLLQEADHAMYIAKRSGRNQFAFYQPQSREAAP